MQGLWSTTMMLAGSWRSAAVGNVRGLAAALLVSSVLSSPFALAQKTGFFEDDGSKSGTTKSATKAGEPSIVSDESAKQALSGRVPRLDELFGPPTTTEDIWSYLKRDVANSYDLDIPIHISKLLLQNDLDAKIPALMEDGGAEMTAGLSAKTNLSKATRPLLDRIYKRMSAYYGDPARISKMIGNLQKSDSERGYATIQLGRAGQAAVWPLLQAYKSASEPAARSNIERALSSLPGSVWRPIACALDSKDPELAQLATRVLGQLRPGSDSVPDLSSYLMEGLVQPGGDLSAASAAGLRNQLGSSAPISAGNALAGLVGHARNKVTQLNDSTSFTDQANLWMWSDEGPKATRGTVHELNRRAALRSAAKVLEVDPANREAASAWILAETNRAFGSLKAAGKWTIEPPAAVATMLSSGNISLTDLIARATQTGAHRSAFHLLQILATQRKPEEPLDSAMLAQLHVALRSAEPRVSLLAAQLIAQSSGAIDPTTADMVVDVLRRSAESSRLPNIVVIDGDTGRGNRIARLAEGAGFSGRAAGTGQAGFELATSNANTAAIVLYPGFGDPSMNALLPSIQNDYRTAHLPVLVCDDSARYSAIIDNPKTRVAKSRVVIVDDAPARANAVAQSLRDAGFESMPTQTGRAGFVMARETSDVVAVILEPGFKDWYIEETLRHFREDPVANKIPVYIMRRPAMSTFVDELIGRNEVAKPLDYRVQAADFAKIFPNPAAARFGTVPVPDLARKRQLDGIVGQYPNARSFEVAGGPEYAKDLLDFEFPEWMSRQLTATDVDEFRELGFINLSRLASQSARGYQLSRAISVFGKYLASDDYHKDAAAALQRIADPRCKEWLLDTAVNPQRSISSRIAAAQALSSATTASLSFTNKDRTRLVDAFRREPNQAIKIYLAKMLNRSGSHTPSLKRELAYYAGLEVKAEDLKSLTPPTKQEAEPVAEPELKEMKPTKEGKEAKKEEKKKKSFFDD